MAHGVAGSSNGPASHYGGKNVWILKPTGFNRGMGIHVFDNLETFD